MFRAYLRQTKLGYDAQEVRFSKCILDLKLFSIYDGFLGT